MAADEYLIFEPYYLTSFSHKDVDRVVEAMNNDDITATLAGPAHKPYLREHGEEFVNVAMNSTYKGLNKVWAIRDKSSNNLFVGTVDIRPSDDSNPISTHSPGNSSTQNTSAAFGFWLHPDYWGKRITSSALKVLIDDIGKRQMDIHNFQGDAVIGNYASRKVFENNGFHMVREEKDAVVKKTTGQLLSRWVLERNDR